MERRYQGPTAGRVNESYRGQIEISNSYFDAPIVFERGAQAEVTVENNWIIDTPVATINEGAISRPVF